MAEWHTPTSAAAEWRDLPTGESGRNLLAAARIQCEAFAPVPGPDQVGIPETYRMAHLMQAKAIWQAQTTGNANATGDYEAGGQTVRVYPMDWNVKSMLRPARGMPGIG